MSRQTNARGVRMGCAHCGTIARQRSSKTVTSTYRELYFQCENVLCGHSWKASLSFLHTLSPSAVPLPGLNLPMAPASAFSGRRLPAPANDEHPSVPAVTPRIASNDDAAEVAV